MYATDLSAVLPPHERQIYDTLTAKAVRLLRERQGAEAATMRQARRPVCDRMRIQIND